MSTTEAVAFSFLSSALRERAAAGWVDAALSEHASVASFARFVQELMALAAPPELLEDALQAAREEVEHARASFEIASRLFGESVGPGPLPVLAPRTLDHAELALATFEEACVDETLGALAAAEAAARCEVDEVRGILERIAVEEARHAELAWRTLGWALGAGGAPVRAVLTELRDAIPDSPAPPAHPDSDDTIALLRAGVIPEVWLDARRAQVTQEIVRPTLDALLRARVEGGPGEAASLQDRTPQSPQGAM